MAPSRSRTPHRSGSRSELVRGSDEECERTIRDRISLYDSIIAAINANSAPSTAASTSDSPQKSAQEILTSPPPDQASHRHLHNDNSLHPNRTLNHSSSRQSLHPHSHSRPSSSSSPSPGSAPFSSSPVPFSPVTPISPSPQSSLLVPPEISAAWHQPWHTASPGQNEAALKEFIKLPLSPEMICYMAVRTEDIFKSPSSPLPERDESGSPTDPPAEQPQWPPLRTFIATLVERANIKTGNLMAALVYLDRFRRMLGPGVNPTPGVCCYHRIFLACLVLTSKYINDASLRNGCWAKCSVVADWNVTVPPPPNPDGTPSTKPAVVVPFHFRTHEVTRMEKELLARLQWNLAITPDDLYGQLDYFLAPIRLRQSNLLRAVRKAASTGSLLAPPLSASSRPSTAGYSPSSWIDSSSMMPNPGSFAVVGVPERTPSLSPPSRVPSSSRLGRVAGSSGPLATPSTASTLSTSTSGSSTRRRNRLHSYLSTRKSFAALSSVSPSSGHLSQQQSLHHQPYPPSKPGALTSTSSTNLLHPSHTSYSHHPYATYSRSSRRAQPHSHGHSHSSTSTISTLSTPSALSATSQGPVYAHPHFANPPPPAIAPSQSHFTLPRAASRAPTGRRHPHVRQPSSGVDQALFDAAVANGYPDFGAGTGGPGSGKLPGDAHLSTLPPGMMGMGIDMPMGVPSTQAMGSEAAPVLQPTPLKASRSSNFFLRFILGRS